MNLEQIGFMLYMEEQERKSKERAAAAPVKPSTVFENKSSFWKERSSTNKNQKKSK